MESVTQYNVSTGLTSGAELQQLVAWPSSITRQEKKFKGRKTSEEVIEGDMTII